MPIGRERLGFSCAPTAHRGVGFDAALQRARSCAEAGEAARSGARKNDAFRSLPDERRGPLDREMKRNLAD